MKCLMCSHYWTETCIKENFSPSFAKMFLKELDELGFDGYCSELDVYVLEESCCSNYHRRNDV